MATDWIIENGSEREIIKITQTELIIIPEKNKENKSKFAYQIEDNALILKREDGVPKIMDLDITIKKVKNDYVFNLVSNEGRVTIKSVMKPYKYESISESTIMTE